MTTVSGFPFFGVRFGKRGEIEVGCDFCGQQERFDAVDVGRLFTPAAQQSPEPGSVQ